MRDFLLFLVTAALTTLALGAILPPVARRTFDLKLEAYATRKDECNLLVVGTSQAFYGIDPSLFDARTRELGVETRTFNLGDPEAGLAELHGHLRSVARMEPRALRWILVEAERIMRVGDETAFLTPKLIATADLETTALLWTYFGEVEPRPLRRTRARLRTLLALAYHVLGVGRGSQWVERTLGTGPTEEDRRNALGRLGDGYFDLEDKGEESIEARPERYARKKREIERRALQVLASRGSLRPSTPGARPFYARIEELGRAMGAQVIFFTIRHGINMSDARALSVEGAIESLIHFDDPELYPELYDVDATFDGGHFDREGTKRFTLYLADAFTELVKAKK